MATYQRGERNCELAHAGLRIQIVGEAMPFKSKAQERAAFSGALGPEMKERAPLWAKETKQDKLPEHVEPLGKDFVAAAKRKLEKMRQHKG